MSSFVISNDLIIFLLSSDKKKAPIEIGAFDISCEVKR